MKVNLMTAAIICCLPFSCTKWGNRENSRLIEQAQQLIEQMPDSALTLLGMVNTFSFGNAKKAEYTLLRVQARSAAGMDLSTDTEIFDARDYFIRKNDPKKAALACFYAGQTLIEQGKANEAVACYLKANDFASQFTDDQLKGQIAYQIGYANYMLDLYDQSLSYLMQAVEFYKNAGNSRSEIRATILIGNCYLLKQQNDSAFYFYGIAEKLAHNLNDTVMQLAVLQNTGVACLQTGNHARAADLYHEALALANRKDSAQLLSNLANLYLDTGQTDTAFAYSQKALAQLDTTINSPVLLNVYRQMLLIEAHRGNGEKAVDYFLKYNLCLDEILKMEEKKSLLDIQRKYDFEKMQDEYSIKKRNYVIAFLSALIVALGLMLWSFNLRKGKKQLEIRIADLLIRLNDLNETKEQFQKLKEAKMSENSENNGTGETQELNRLKKRHEEQYKTFITYYFDMLSRIERECRNAPDQTMVKIESLNRILFGNAHIDFWSAAVKLIPEGLIEKIKKMFPELDNTEMKICCLTYLNADTVAISIALGVKDETIYTLNSRIRGKLKIGARKNIKRFLEEKLSK